MSYVSSSFKRQSCSLVSGVLLGLELQRETIGVRRKDQTNILACFRVLLGRKLCSGDLTWFEIADLG